MTVNTKTVEVVTEEVQTMSVTCDFCGRTFSEADASYGEDRIYWTASDPDKEIITSISMEHEQTGVGDGDNAFSVVRAYHACPDCMSNKIFPALAVMAKTGPHSLEEGDCS